MSLTVSEFSKNRICESHVPCIGVTDFYPYILCNFYPILEVLGVVDVHTNVLGDCKFLFFFFNWLIEIHTFLRGVKKFISDFSIRLKNLVHEICLKYCCVFVSFMELGPRKAVSFLWA